MGSRRKARRGRAGRVPIDLHHWWHDDKWIDQDMLRVQARASSPSALKTRGRPEAVPVRRAGQEQGSLRWSQPHVTYPAVPEREDGKQPSEGTAQEVAALRVMLAKREQVLNSSCSDERGARPMAWSRTEA